MSNKKVHDFTVKNLKGEEVSLDEYKGKVLMIVNTASKCGLTPQYEGLENLYKKFHSKGFEILGFPSNDFAGQEPLNGEQIEEFCQVNYGVSFPMMDKIHVKGSSKHPLYDYLGDKKQNGKTSAKPRWNFHKYLVDKDGNVVDYFLPITTPESKKVEKAIEKLLED